MDRETKWIEDMVLLIKKLLGISALGFYLVIIIQILTAENGRSW